MAFDVVQGKLGHRQGDITVALKNGTLDTPEAVYSNEGKMHVLPYFWNPDTLAYEVSTGGSTPGANVKVTNFPATQAVTGPLTDAELRATPVPTTSNLHVKDIVSGAWEPNYGHEGVAITQEYLTAIGLGLVPGHTRLRTFGQRTGLSTASGGDDIWEGTATTLPVPDQSVGEQMTIVSSSASDTLAGVGVQKVDIHYIDASGNPQVEIVNLNGTTPVNTVATNIRFVNFFHSEQVGTTGFAVGTISIYRTGDATRVYSVITPGGNRALTAALMVPLGKTYHVTSFCTSGASGKPISVRFRATCTEESVLTSFFLYKDVVFLQDSSYVHDFRIPLVFPALTLVKATAFSTQAGGSCSVALAGWLE